MDPYKNVIKADNLPLPSENIHTHKFRVQMQGFCGCPEGHSLTSKGYTNHRLRLSYTMSSSKTGPGPFSSLYPRHTGDTQKSLLKKSMNCSWNPHFFPSEGPWEINGFIQDHKPKAKSHVSWFPATPLNVPVSPAHLCLFNHPTTSASFMYSLPRVQDLGFQSRKEKWKVRRKGSERSKTMSDLALGPASWHSHPTLPQELVEGLLWSIKEIERAVNPGQPSVPFVSDGMEGGDGYIDLICSKCST